MTPTSPTNRSPSIQPKCIIRRASRHALTLVNVQDDAVTASVRFGSTTDDSAALAPHRLLRSRGGVPTRLTTAGIDMRGYCSAAGFAVGQM